MAYSINEMRRMLFTPCMTKEHLSRWVRLFIGIDFPDAVVLEESNSSPMDALWLLYSKAISNDDEGFARVMSYAARGSYKTLSASVLEVALVLHTPRNVAHLAATQARPDGGGIGACSLVKEVVQYRKTTKTKLSM